MKKTTLPLFACFVLAASALLSTQAKSQVRIVDEPIERPILLWHAALENTRIKYKVSPEDFGTFSRFEMTPLQLMRINVIREGKKDSYDSKLLTNAFLEFQKNLDALYEKFLDTKKQYPSSVAEYAYVAHRIGGNPCDSTGSTNIDFENGNFSTWYGYYATNNSSTANRNIGPLTGGALGAVTEACNDPGVLAAMQAAFWPSMVNDYQLSITSSGNDNIVPSISRVSPFGGKHSVMLGDSNIIESGVAVLSKTFLVTASNSNLSYQYALFLQNPGHTYWQQPFFSVTILDDLGDTIPNCGVNNIVSFPVSRGFDSLTYGYFEGINKTYYRPWTAVNVPLTKYIGKCVTLIFEVGDCALDAHFGYAYVDASCAPLKILSSSPVFCGQSTISLTAPQGAVRYKWSGPAGGISGSDTLKIIKIDSAGTYQVTMVPFTGMSCSDTLTINIPKGSGTVPVPGFTADSICEGMATQFANTSIPIGGSGVNFYWDFNNNGYYEDSTTNPLWAFPLPGIYSVKLHEVNNGCGADTLINVKVDSAIIGGFISLDNCINQPVTFRNNTIGAASYKWNFGDPSSGSADTTSVKNPMHTYDSGGTYTVTLISASHGICVDTVRDTVHIFTVPKPCISGTDSICPGGHATITAGCGLGYAWSTGETTSSITVNPITTSTYTVIINNGSCGADTTFTVVVKACCTNHYNQDICIVSTDTTIDKNSIIWDRNNLPPDNATSFVNIYDSTLSGWVKIGTVADTALSEYMDTASNPSTQAYSYRISTVDSCGESALSPFNSTIYLQVALLTGRDSLYWTPYVGFATPHYYIYRGLSLGALTLIDSVSGGTFNYVDILPPAGSMYLVEAVNPLGGCLPTHRRISGSEPSISMSNAGVPHIPTGIAGILSPGNSVHIFPNPNTGSFTISLSGINGKSSVEIYNMLGQQVFTTKLNASTTQVDLGNNSDGIYLYRVLTETGSLVSEGKFIIQK